MKILAIETSCDETACAIVEKGVKEICSVVASSKEFHEETGGVVPEVAARMQVEYIIPVIESVVGVADLRHPQDDIDAIAVTVGPGLMGSLIVGVEAAKALALAWNKPLIPVNHLIGHLYANHVSSEREIPFPSIALLVSGGHTDLILIKSHGNFEFIGGTLDDAAGEAFDKTARLLGISNYLGGALLSKKAAECKENVIKGKLPRPMLNKDNFDFSFSGLKTAVRRLVEKESLPVEVVAYEFEQAVVDVLVAKTIRAAEEYKVSSILLGGGVSANLPLRSRFEKECSKKDLELFIPPLRLCTDNAVYIASAAYFNQKEVSLEDIQPNPSMGITD